MQPFASHASTDWVLVTGQPGCGKTTAVKKLVDELRSRGASVRGFYTDEVLSGGRRVGFDIVSVPDGRRGPLARKCLAPRTAAEYLLAPRLRRAQVFGSAVRHGQIFGPAVRRGQNFGRAVRRGQIFGLGEPAEGQRPVNGR